MNQIITGAGGILIVICMALYAGYMLGKRDSEVNMRINPLVIADCTIPLSSFMPINRTFGATTLQLKLLAKQYSLCATACTANTVP